MVHAAAWIVDNASKPPHGPVFKKWANEAMKAIPDVEVTTTHSYEIAYKFAWACTTPKCGAVFKRQSRSIDVEKHVCGRCKGKLMEIEVPSYGQTTGFTPRKKAPPSAYNRFVSEKYAQIRERLQAGSTIKVKQSEVMKECARLWKEQKRDE
jgi:hypothetical protein